MARKPQVAVPADEFGQALNSYRRGNRDDAERRCRALLKRVPAHAEALHLLAMVELDARRCDEALAHARTAVGLRPDHSLFHDTLGRVHQALRQYPEAAQSFQESLRKDPGNPNPYYHLGMVFYAMKQWEKAVECFMATLQLNPKLYQAFNAMGNALARMRRLEESILAFRRALKLHPHYAEAHLNLAISLLECGRVEEALDAYQASLKADRDAPQAHSDYVFALNYVPWLDMQAVSDAHREWARRHAPRQLAVARHANLPNPERRLRIGYVSSDFHRHPVAYYFENVLRHHDCARYEAHGYWYRVSEDEVTGRLRQQVDGWHEMTGLPPEEAAKKIAADGIDILVDLAGHTGHNQLQVFARKPAPVQVSWLGYFNTTGLDAIDWFVTDAVSSPAGQEAYFVEKLARLPHVRFSYAPPEYAPPVAPSPALRSGRVTFGCFNNLAKINHKVVALWAAILKAVPDGRLLLKAKSFDDEATRMDYLDRFRAQGIDESRLELRPSSPHAEMLAEYGEVDIALDPFPFTGALTTSEALWMGVPVLTLAGESLVSRQGAAFMEALGMGAWVAQTPEAYQEIAVAMVGDIDALAATRAGLRERMAASPLCDGTAFTAALESAYREMWREWCMKQGRV